MDRQFMIIVLKILLILLFELPTWASGGRVEFEEDRMNKLANDALECISRLKEI